MPTFRRIQGTPTLLIRSIDGPSLAFPVPLSIFRGRQRGTYAGEPRLTSRSKVDLLRQPAREMVPWHVP